MSLLLETAALRTYDALKGRTRTARRSDARDAGALSLIHGRLREMIGSYRLSTQQEYGNTYVFWSEISAAVDAGAFDDLRDRL